MEFNLKDKVCLVTGASGGIGFALVKSFLARGAKCLMTDVSYRVRFQFTDRISIMNPKPFITLK